MNFKKGTIILLDSNNPNTAAIVFGDNKIDNTFLDINCYFQDFVEFEVYGEREFTVSGHMYDKKYVVTCIFEEEL